MRRLVVPIAIWLLTATPAFAQSGFNFGPDVGQQMARGSAWVARADSPLAAYFNPAGLVRQPASVVIGTHVMGLDRCFFRVNTDGSPVSPGAGLPAPGTPNGPPAGVCETGGAFLNSQAGLTIGLGTRMKFGAALVAPHNVGNQTWPDVVTGPAGPQPSPSRFLLVDEESLLVYPTFSLGYQVTDTLAIGGGFVWGFYRETASAFAEGRSPTIPVPRDNFFANEELKLVAHGHSNLVPGGVFGMLWSPSRTIDVGLWFHKSARLDSEAELTLESRYWTPTGARNTTPCGPTEPSDCNITNLTAKGGIALPSELRGGARYHRPRNASAPQTGDPIVDDVFDIEVDAAWADNSAVTGIDLDLRANRGMTVRGVNAPTFIPDTAEEPKRWKDSGSLRVGGEYVVKPGRFALQAGTFYENKGQLDAYLGNHFDLASKYGIAGGAVLRLRRRIDAYIAYQHISWADLENGGQGTVYGFSMDRSSDNGTNQPVNGGRITSSLNELAAGVTFRF